MQTTHSFSLAIPGRKKIIVSAILLALGAAPALADGPAVESINGKISVEGGRFGPSDGALNRGSLSLPLGYSFGLQVDGAIGRFLSRDYAGVALHAFWRDPEKGLLGLLASNATLGTVGVTRTGVEAEWYLNDISLKGYAGQQGSSVSGGTATPLPTGGYSSAKASWYPTQNVALVVGLGNSPGMQSSMLGAEWQLGMSDLPGMSLFAETVSATGNRDRTTVGMRYYFGNNKSLIKRHRTDDPDEAPGSFDAGAFKPSQFSSCPSLPATMGGYGPPAPSGCAAG